MYLPRFSFLAILTSLLLTLTTTGASALSVFEQNGNTTIYIGHTVDGDRQPMQAYVIANPYRLIVDGAFEPSALAALSFAPVGQVAKVSAGRTASGLTRVVFQLRGPAKLAPLRQIEGEPRTQAVLQLTPTAPESFVSMGFDPAGKRIILDVERAAETPLREQVRAKSKAGNVPRVERNSAYTRLHNQIDELPIMTARSGLRGSKSKPVIVIDPGHGGKDPGAQGLAGIPEKQLVLEFGQELARLLRASGRYQVFLTRDTDKFIPLRRRTALARSVDADLFISIHADSSDAEYVRGASVYYLSEEAAYAEADKLSDRADRSNVLDGLNLNKQDPMVASILIGLAQRETVANSARFSRELMVELSKSWPTVRRPMRRAGFAVLKSPELPSVLLEMGFITNSADAAILSRPEHRQILAGRVLTAIDKYFSN